MTDSCCANPSAGSAVCELPTPAIKRVQGPAGTCHLCGGTGKPVQGQTVKALLSVTLRQIQNTEYFLCRTPSCPVVYFTTDGKQTFEARHVRERVFQKEPEADDVLVCYCFRHTRGEIRAASPEARASILEDITTGIQADQCACDLRNPQGSCCLGNVRVLIKRFSQNT